MKYTIIKFNAPFYDTKKAIFDIAKTKFNNTTLNNGEISAEIPFSKESKTEVKHYELRIAFKPYNGGTAVLLEIQNDAGIIFDYALKPLLNDAEKTLKTQPTKINIEPSFFDLAKTSESDTNTKESTSTEVNEAIPSKQRFDEIVEKLLSLKELEKKEIITKQEFKEKSRDLIEEL